MCFQRHWFLGLILNHSEKLLISREAQLAGTTMQRTKWNIMSRQLTNLSLPSTISVVGDQVSPAVGWLYWAHPVAIFFFFAVHVHELALLHSVVHCCKNTYEKHLYTEETYYHFIPISYHSVQPISCQNIVGAARLL